MLSMMFMLNVHADILSYFDINVHLIDFVSVR